jgi:hypothetical protein
VIALRGFDRTSLRVWVLSTERFSHEDRFEKLLRVTGGWPVLVEEAAALVAGGLDENEALQRIADRVDTPEGAAALVEQVGLPENDDLLRAFDALVSLAEFGGVERSYLFEAVDGVVEDPTTTLECLLALQVFNVGSEGTYELEPLLVRAWQRR